MGGGGLKSHCEIGALKTIGDTSSDSGGLSFVKAEENIGDKISSYGTSVISNNVTKVPHGLLLLAHC